eukprot:scaffold139990_cov15-Prasinocladus_malaysianus.AAC.1
MSLDGGDREVLYGDNSGAMTATDAETYSGDACRVILFYRKALQFWGQHRHKCVLKTVIVGRISSGMPGWQLGSNRRAGTRYRAV